MPAKASEQSAITTVKPAKTTAPPAVAVARAIDSRSSIPSRELQFVAGDDEQRVVDPDAEPDHRRQGRGDARHLDHVLQQADDRERAGEAEIAETIGSTIAVAVPKAKSRMITAAASPIASLTSVSGLESCWPT